MSRTTYAALFAAIGTSNGPGDATTTFNLPDYRGRSPIGAGTGVGAASSGASGTAPSGTSLTARAVGDWGGEETHVLTAAELAAHHHTLNYNAGTADNLAGTIGLSRFTGPASLQTDDAGSNSPHNTVHPFLGVRFIIKY